MVFASIVGEYCYFCFLRKLLVKDDQSHLRSVPNCQKSFPISLTTGAIGSIFCGGVLCNRAIFSSILFSFKVSLIASFVFTTASDFFTSSFHGFFSSTGVVSFSVGFICSVLFSQERSERIYVFHSLSGIS